MLRYDFETLSAGQLPNTNTKVLFHGCKFTGPLPDFDQCEFHNCDLSGTKVGKLLRCLLFSTNLTGCDFTTADVSFSRTHPGSPCRVDGAKWTGFRGVFDCGWFQGLQTEDDSAWQFVALATIPDTPDREEIKQLIPRRQRRELSALLAKPFRKR